MTFPKRKLERRPLKICWVIFSETKINYSRKFAISLSLVYVTANFKFKKFDNAMLQISKIRKSCLRYSPNSIYKAFPNFFFCNWQFNYFVLLKYLPWEKLDNLYVKQLLQKPELPDFLTASFYFWKEESNPLKVLKNEVLSRIIK